MRIESIIVHTINDFVPFLEDVGWVERLFAKPNAFGELWRKEPRLTRPTADAGPRREHFHGFCPRLSKTSQNEGKDLTTASAPRISTPSTQSPIKAKAMAIR